MSFVADFLPHVISLSGLHQNSDCSLAKAEVIHLDKEETFLICKVFGFVYFTICVI